MHRRGAGERLFVLATAPPRLYCEDAGKLVELEDEVAVIEQQLTVTSTPIHR
jgi:hypothetical protein